jgi:hypothetical protein
MSQLASKLMLPITFSPLLLHFLDKCYSFSVSVPYLQYNIPLF